MRRTISTTVVVLAASFAVAAAANPQQGGLRLKTIAEKEIRVVQADGGTEILRVPAGKVIPGDEIIYTIEATNVTEQPVGDVVITDPVPEHTVYVDGSAEGTDVQITFSIDDGQSYDLPQRLIVKQSDGTARTARPSEYTHIQWRFTRALDPGQTRLVGFRAKLQ